MLCRLGIGRRVQCRKFGEEHFALKRHRIVETEDRFDDECLQADRFADTV
jgi:hypothetical protein